MRTLSFLVAFTFLISSQLYSQVVQQTKKLGISFDLVGPIKTVFDKDYLNLEGQINFGSLRNFYPTVEYGMLKYNKKTTDNLKNNYNYASNGNYLRLGFDYNTFKKNLQGENNLVLFGLRYGMATLSHNADNIIIRDTIWGTTPQMKFSQNDMKANWIEIVGGIKVELIKNLTLGWTMRLDFLINTNGMAGTKPFYIPGYGRGNKNLTIWYTYTIGYNVNFTKMGFKK